MNLPFAKHHIVFVSDQLLPSVLGIATPGAEPVCIHAIVTEKMKHKNAALRMVVEGRCKSYREYGLSNTDQQHIFTLLNDIQSQCEGQIPMLNLTGGTKLMALAAAEWAYANDVPTFYIDTATDQIVLLGLQWEYFPLPDILNFRDLLGAYGYSVEKFIQAPVPQERRTILSDMLALICSAHPDTEKSLRSLNFYAQQAKTARDMVVEDKAVQTEKWKELLNLCRNAGMLQYGNGYVTFPNEEARAWCNGIWLEEFVRMALYKLKNGKKINSWASSVNVVRNKVANELDAIFSVRNRLFIIECKTAKINSSNNHVDSSRISNVLYKADSLHDRLGGIFAQSMLCSIEPLSQAEQKRAREMGIVTVTGKELLKLDEILLRWSSKA